MVSYINHTHDFEANISTNKWGFYTSFYDNYRENSILIIRKAGSFLSKQVQHQPHFHSAE